MKGFSEQIELSGQTKIYIMLVLLPNDMYRYFYIVIRFVIVYLCNLKCLTLNINLIKSIL